MRRVAVFVVLALLSGSVSAPAGEVPAPRRAPRKSKKELPLSSATRQALQAHDEGLVETPLPGGGVAVDLQGRYRVALVAEVGADGKLRIECVSHLPAESAKEQPK